MAEEWRPVVGYEGLYEVSSIGRVSTLRTAPRLMRQWRTSGDYRAVTLSVGGHRKNMTVHRMVAAAFLGPATGPLVRHLDGDSTNNTVGNLAWGDALDNSRDSEAHGTFRLRELRRKPNDLCASGHPITQAKSGKRECHECHRLRQKARREARRLAATR